MHNKLLTFQYKWWQQSPLSKIGKGDRRLMLPLSAGSKGQTTSGPELSAARGYFLNHSPSRCFPPRQAYRELLSLATSAWRLGRQLTSHFHCGVKPTHQVASHYCGYQYPVIYHPIGLLSSLLLPMVQSLFNSARLCFSWKAVK